MISSTLTAPRQRSPLTDYFELRKRWRANIGLYVQQRFGVTPTWQQQAILDALVPTGAKVSVRSGHGIGKTSAAAWGVSWFAETHDYAKVPCTAPTAHQLRDILWGELSKWRRLADEESAKRGDHPRFWISQLFRLVTDALLDNSAREWGAFARTAKKENPEALQGFHAQHLMFVIDEGSGIPEEVFEAAEGALSTPGARVLMLGNPTRNSGTFAASHKQSRGDYTALHFRSQDSPLVDPSYRDRLVRKWGEGSNVVRVRADGEFPRQEDDVLISLELTEPCTTREPRQGFGPRRLGVDVAWKGADRTTLVLRQGAVVDHLAVYAKDDTMVTVGHIMQILEPWKVDEIYVDVVGLGAGVHNRLDELRREGRHRCAVIAVNVAEKAPPTYAPTDARGYRLRDHLWLEMKRWLQEDEPVFCAEDRMVCEDLAGELASVAFKPNSQGLIVIEDKDSMRKRLGRSPDCFVAGTLVRTPTGLCPIESLGTGDLVSTPMGPRPILYCHATMTDRLTTVVFSNGSTLTGKGKHQIFTWDRGWIRLDALSLVNAIESDNLWRRFLWQCLGQWCMPVKPFGFKHQVDIISQGGRMRRRDFFIDASMRTIMARFLQAMLCTIVTGIGETIPRRISRWWSKAPILLRTCVNGWQILPIGRAPWQAWRKPNRPPARGMRLRRAWPGIVPMVVRRGSTALLPTSAASTVERPSRRPSRLARSFARMRAGVHNAIATIKRQLGSVSTVGVRSSITNIVGSRTVPVRVVTATVAEKTPVYNLTLDGDNVYYANGILVANCADGLGCTFGQSAVRWAGTF